MKKFSFGEGGIKGLFTKHVEKMIFGVCVVLVLLFIFTGFSLQTYKKVPKEIQDLAQDAKKHIEVDTWEEVKADADRITTTNYEVAVKEGNVPTKGKLYPHEMPLQPIVNRLLVKRSDPKLQKTVKLVVTSMITPIAMPNKSEATDKLAALKESPSTRFS